MNWLNNKLINKSEVARQIGISTILFRMKLKNVNRSSNVAITPNVEILPMVGHCTTNVE